MKKRKKMILKGIMSMGMALCLSVITCITGHAGEAETMNTGAVLEFIGTGEAPINPMAVNMDKAAVLSITSGVAAASAKVKGTPGEVTKISITMYLQKKSANGSYATIKTWSGSVKRNYYNLKHTQKVSKGTYRVKAKITCYKGSKAETSVRYSSARIYR